nr:DUF1501 domain-containing protein [Candidatus Laterigemmans baculatus]
MMPPPISPAAHDLLDRRRFLSHTGTSLGAIALASLLQGEQRTKAGEGSAEANAADKPWNPTIDPAHPYRARPPHHRARADQVILIFCSGALSQVDTFDFKPALFEHDGRPLPGADALVTFQGENGNLTRPIREFHPRGECGKMTSELLPHLGSLADDLCFIHSLTTKTNTHGPGENVMSTGFNVDGFPSMGAWSSYALGSENSDLPTFIAIPDPRGLPQSAGNNWGPGFLPALFQGTAFNASQPIRYLDPPQSISPARDRATAQFLKSLNARDSQNFGRDNDLAARIASYELAARMQLAVPQVTNLSQEPSHILRSYGADQENNKTKAAYARNCILARRLIEQGVRFVQLFNGAYAMGEGVGNWDGHKQIADQYPGHAEILDQPTAALIRDLKQRGLLERTLVIFCTEFGRMPTFQKGASGRDHNPEGFTAFLAGAGVKAPLSFGATDEFGYRAVEDVVSVHDFHATILHLLGLDHERLTYYHNGTLRRLTDVHGHVIEAVLS